MRLFLTMSIAALALSGGSAYAQDHGRVGITMGYPSTLGVLWHVSDRVAILPEIAASRASSESVFESTSVLTGGSFLNPTTTTVTTRITSTSKGWTVAPSLNVLFYVGKWDNVSAYVAPGVSYYRTKTTQTTISEGPSLGIIGATGGTTTSTNVRDYTSDGYGVQAMFGVQYTPHRRFGVFGETGVRYSKSETASVNTETSITGSRANVGVIFYF